ncbi:MAG: zinc ABC transporter substrate-binding protein [Gammaproteobacteria bacterium]
MNCRRIPIVVAVFALATDPVIAQDADTDHSPVVLTGTQATYSVTSALVLDTPIEVVNVPEDGREFAVLRAYLERRKDRFAMLFSAATAVVALTNALPGDPLYRYAREANVGIVNIDAAIPWTFDTPGVALIDMPDSDVQWATPSTEASEGIAPWFWLSIPNTLRMADIVANDLAALYPAFEATISANLDRFKRTLLETRAAYQNRLLEAADDTVFALTGDFVYMTNDLGLFVDGYFIRQDVDWTNDDLTALTAYLRAHEIGVVIHKWVPSDAIQAAVQAAGAQLVVLDTGDQGRIVGDTLAPDGLQQILVDNLEKITSALSQRE